MPFLLGLRFSTFLFTKMHIRIIRQDVVVVVVAVWLQSNHPFNKKRRSMFRTAKQEETTSLYNNCRTGSYSYNYQSVRVYSIYSLTVSFLLF